MDQHHDVDVLIAGAGPTGLTLAVDLARRGIRHRIVERTPGGRPARAARGCNRGPRRSSTTSG